MTRARKPARPLLAATDRLHDLAMRAAGLTLTARSKVPPASVSAHTPWILVTRLEPLSGAGGITYEAIGRILQAWESNRVLERQIGPQRASRIRVLWRDGAEDGEYTIAEIGPWARVISRAVQRVMRRDGRRSSLVARYGQSGRVSQSTVIALEVWLSAALAVKGRISAMP